MTPADTTHNATTTTPTSTTEIPDNAPLPTEKAPESTADDSGRKVETVEMVETEGILFSKLPTKTTETNITSYLPLLTTTEFREFLITQSQTQSILYYLYQYGDMTYEQIGTHIGRDANRVSIICNKPSIKDSIEKKNDERPATWGLTTTARTTITEELTRWKRAQQHAAEKLAFVATQQESLEKEQDQTTRSFKEWDLYLELIETDVLNAFTKGDWMITIDFQHLQTQSPWLAELLLNEPEHTIKTLEIATDKRGLLQEKPPKRHLEVTIKGLPSPNQLSLRDLRSRDLTKLRWSNAEIEMCSDVRPEAVTARFECPSCGNVLHVLQAAQTFREPTRCGCGRKGKFKQLDKELKDTAIIWVTEPLGEILGSANARTRVRAELQGDELTKVSLMRRLGPGVPVRLSYVPLELPILLKTGGLSKRFDIYLKVTGIDILDNYTFSLDFSDEEIERFEEAAQQKGFLEKFARSAYPAHYGDDEVKHALVAQLVSGNFTQRIQQEQIHILLMGDPGVGKTTNLLCRTQALAPIAHLVSATNSSTAGLLGSAGQKDPYTNRQMFEPGVLPRHNRGIVCIDEVNALQYEDLKACNEALQSGTVTIDKANIHQKAPTDVRILAAANPKNGRFNDVDKINADVLGIEPSFLDRFDCVFILRDRHSRERDEHIVDRMNALETGEDLFPDDFMQRYILHARDKIKPVLTPEVGAILKEFFVSLRSSGKDASTLPVSARQYGALRALTLCFAKLHLREHTTVEDVARAATVFEVMFRAFGYNMSTLHAIMPKPQIPVVSPTVVADDGKSRQPTEHDAVLAFVRSQEGGAKLTELHEKFPRADIERLLRSGDLAEWKHGIVRVNE